MEMPNQNESSSSPLDLEKLAPGTLAILILPQPYGSVRDRSQTLGLIWTRDGMRPQVFIFYDRILKTADEVKALLGHPSVKAFILAHTIVHEVGHFFIGPEHSQTGLMRQQWKLNDVWEMLHGGLTFTEEQAGKIRSKLACR
jgi:hypothetical protein